MDHHNYRSRLSLTILSTMLLAACAGTRGPVSQAPPATIRADNTETVRTDGVPSASGQVHAERDAPIDVLAGVLIQVRQLTSRGEESRRNGRTEQAQRDFEAALDLLWDYSRDRESDFQVEREIDYLISRLGTLELAVTEEPAAIDELADLDISTRVLDLAIRDSVEPDVGASGSGLPIQLNDRVLAFLEYYTVGRGRRSIEAGLERAGLYAPMIHRILAEEGLPEDLIHLAQAESAFRPQALSRAAAKGLWQFIPSRGKEYGLRQTPWIDERSDPEKSTQAAARHLKDLYAQFGDWDLAMAAYNAGPARVQRAIERAGVADFWTLADENLLPTETRNYVPTILAMTLIGRQPARYGFDVQPSKALEVERVAVSEATDLRVIAESLELPLETIHNLNPHILRWATPPEDEEFELILPQGYRTAFEARVAPLRAQERILFYYHVVSAGETVSRLSEEYGISVTAIAEANNLNQRNLIRVGQSLVIPLSEVPMRGTAMAEAAPAQSPPDVYRVRRGDTLSRIAERFSLTVGEIKSWNNMSSNFLLAGASLRLAPTEEVPAAASVSSEPGTVIYQVRSGDTLSQIAATYQTSVEALRTWNSGLDLAIIRPGDQITIFCTTEHLC